MRKTVVILLVLLSLFPLFSKGRREETPTPLRPPLSKSNTFTIGVSKGDDILFLDPFDATDAHSILVMDGLFEGLFSLDPKSGNPVFAIAKEVTTSSDGLRWSITIDSKARFSNGEAITAATFVESWLYLLERTAKEEGTSYLVSLLGCVEGVNDYLSGKGSKSSIGLKAPNRSTIEIRLHSVAPYLPDLLTTLPFRAIHSSQRDQEGGAIISSGAYEINSMGDNSLILEKNRWYRDFYSVSSDYIEIKFLSPEELISQYKEGKLHWSTGYIPPSQLRTPEDLKLSLEYSTGFFYFSASDGPYSKSGVRKALSLLIPWDELRIQSGQLFPTSRLIPFTKGEKSSTPTTGANRKGALEAIAKEGFPYGAGLPPLHMAIHRGSQVAEVAQKIADIWSSELGITVVLDVVPLSMYSRYPTLSPYDFAFITWIGDFHHPFAFLNLFYGESGYNLGNYRDQQYDQLVLEAMENPSEYRLREAENYLLEERAVIPLYHGFTTNVIDTQHVSQWYDNELNVHPLSTLQLD